MSRFNPWPWIKPFLILVLVLSVPPLLYWFGYVQHSINEAQHQAYVTLSAVATDLRGRLAAYNQIAETAERSQYDSEHLREYLKSLLQTPQVSQAEPATMHLEVSPNGAGLRLHANADCGTSCPPVTAIVSIESLISWDVVESAFDGLLVLNEQGGLIAQNRGLPKQPAGLPVHGSAATQAALRSLFAENASTADEHAADAGNRKGESLFRSPLDFADTTSIDIAGVRYIAFIQPVALPVTPLKGVELKGGDATASLRVIVVGLVRADHLRHAALQLSPEVLVTVGLLVALGLFTIPFLKLRFIGARERMRVRDIWLLAASMLCATVLVVLFILQRHADERLTRRFDGGLKHLAMSLQEHIEREATLARAQLTDVAPELSAGSAACSASLDPNAPKANTSAVNRPDVLRGAIFSSNRDFTYPAFEALFATDACGFQIRKWMPRTIPTPNIDVSAEGYFSAALALPDTSECGARDSCASRYAFGSIVAPTSGLLLGVFAAPASRHDREFGSAVPFTDRAGVVALATPLLSVNAPVIPYPFQFVVVDNGGNVVFQQAQGPFRGERFLDEAAIQQTAADKVRAAKVLKDVREKRSTELAQAMISENVYRGKHYRMLAFWVPELRSTLIAYYDADEIGTIAARTFVTTALFVLGIIASILTGAALARRIFGEGALDWAWPSPGRTPYHLLGIAGGIILIGVFLIAHIVLPPRLVSWVFLLTPAVAMLAAGSNYMVRTTTTLVKRLFRSWSYEAAAKGRWPAIVAFEAFAIVTIFAFVVIPTLIVYQDAFGVHSAAYEEVAHRRYTDAVRKQDSEIFAHTARVAQSLAAPDCKAAAGERPRDIRCVATDRVYFHDPNHQVYRKLKEDFARYQVCVDPSGESDCDASQPVKVPWSFTLDLAYAGARLNSANTELVHALHYFTLQPTTRGDVADFYDVRLSLRNVAGFLLLLGALLLFIGSISKHVLGLGVTDDGVLDSESAFEPENRSRWLLLRPPHEVFRALTMKSGALQTFDLRDRDSKPESIAALAPVANQVILIRHIEARLEEPQWRDALLALIGNPKAGCIVLTSEIDPFYYLAQRLRELRVVQTAGAADKTSADDTRYEANRTELAKWASALSAVRKVRYAPVHFDEPNHGNLSAEAYAVLAKECGVSETLIEAGRQMMRSGDLSNHSADEIVGFVQDAAEPYYRALWDLSSREEKLVMIQLAQEGLVNPHSIEIVVRLARRRLLVVDPKFALMNESFRRFVRNAESPERIADWERGSPGLTWSRLGTPLYAFAAVAIAILLFTQQGLVTSVLAVATGAVGTLGSLRSLYAAVKPAATSQDA